MRIDHIKAIPAVFLQQFTHAFLPLAAKEITVHAVNDGKTFILSDHIRKALLTVPHRRGIFCAANLHNSQFFRTDVVRLPHQVLTRTPSFGIEVGANVSGIKAVVLSLDHPVHQDHRDSCLLRLGQHVVPAGLNDRGKHDHVHLVGNKRTDRVDLLFLLLVGVLHHQAVAGLLRSFLHAGRIGDPPAAFRPQLGKADYDRGFFLLRFLFSGAAGQSQQEHQRQQQRESLLHARSSFYGILPNTYIDRRGLGGDRKAPLFSSSGPSPWSAQSVFSSHPR